MLEMVSFHIHPHLNVFLQILEYYSKCVDVDGFNLLALFDCAGCIFVQFALKQAPKKEVDRRYIGRSAWPKAFFFESGASNERITLYNLYFDAIVVLARYVILLLLVILQNKKST